MNLPRIVLLLFMLSVFGGPLWAPTASAARAQTELARWDEAQDFAQEYRIRLRSDSTRLSDSLAYQIVQAADAYGVDRRVAFQLVWVESRFYDRALSNVGAIGLTQVMPRTGSRVCNLTKRELYVPLRNLDCGLKFYSQLLARYEQNHWFALAAYYRGPARADDIKAQGLGYPESILGS